MKALLSKVGLMKRKYALTVFCTVMGAFVAFRTNATLGEWTVFAMAIIGTFGAADVADKKLNGGTYSEKDPAP